MMLAYNLFLLFKMDFAGESEYRKKHFQMPEFVKVDHKELLTIYEMMLNI